VVDVVQGLARAGTPVVVVPLLLSGGYHVHVDIAGAVGAHDGARAARPLGPDLRLAEVLHTRLTAAPRGATGEHGGATAHVTRALLAVLTTLVEQIKALSEQITEQLEAHPDAHIFTSLPRSGRVRAARLLTEIGDCRARFPTPEALFCLAGAAPSTRQSGKVKIVSFRWAADKQLRDAICDFAGDSRRASPWAAKLYNDAIARGHDHPHAVRILARSWLYIIWRCWQDGVAYDPAKHKALQTLLATQQHAAA
jgi:transposase